jgi:hypothetical protein
VGIGTASPNAANKLEVTGDITTSWLSAVTRFIGSRFIDGTSYELGIKTILDTRETQIIAKGADTGGFVTIVTGSTPTERVRVTSTGLLQFNSGYGSVATAYGCRAWVNFNGTGTVAIRASGNVSSITDNGTGDYTVNFTTAMADANYSDVYGCTAGGSGSAMPYISTANYATFKTASILRFGTFTTAGALQDPNSVSVAIFR